MQKYFEDSIFYKNIAKKMGEEKTDLPIAAYINEYFKLNCNSVEHPQFFAPTSRVVAAITNQTQ
jgi:hypothetical protein